tara:strand:- start:1085 stop:1870 length:786 start_codon:yes stop_codon:yes gene_type:complete
LSLTGKTKAGSYKDLLQMNNSNSGVDATTRAVVDGEGTASSLNISSSRTIVQGGSDTSTKFAVQDADSNNLLLVDSSNDLVKAGAGQHIVNTQIKDFCITSVNSQPSTTNTWTALSSIGSARFVAGVELGTGSTPATSLTISTTANNVVQAMWYVPFNITIDSCNVWFGADDATGDAVKFSVMSYTVDSANGATSGDLSSGTELCNQSLPFNGLGYEQAYYGAMTVASANVDAGKVILACVHQDGTNADLTVNMQLVYHLR